MYTFRDVVNKKEAHFHIKHVLNLGLWFQRISHNHAHLDMLEIYECK